MRRVITVLSALLIAFIMGGAWSWAAPPEGQICDALTTGKVDVQDGTASVSFVAPPGSLITGYCVKAGSAKQGLGAEYVTVDPPAKSVTIAHSSGKDVSHFSVSLTERSTPSPTPTPTPTDTPTPEPSETDTPKPDPTESGGSTPDDKPTTTKPDKPDEDKPRSDKPAPTLPRTGASLELLAVGAGATALGCALYLLARRRV